MPPKDKGKAKASASEAVMGDVDVEQGGGHASKQDDPAQDIAAPPAKRKQSGTGGEGKRKKRFVFNPPVAADLSQHLTQLSNAGLDKIWLTQDHRTKNLNKLTALIKDYGMKVKPGKGLVHNPLSANTSTTLQHVKDLPVFAHRDFVLQEDLVELYTVQREIDGTSVEAWNLTARNENTRELVELFRIPPSTAAGRKCSQNNAVDTEVCPTRQRAIELGRCAVRVMNRVPAKLDVEVWAAARTADNKAAAARWCFSFVRTFVDITAFLMWDPNFDFGLLHDAFHQGSATRQTRSGRKTAKSVYPVPAYSLNYRLDESQKEGRKNMVTLKTEGLLALHLERPYHPPLRSVSMNVTKVNTEAVSTDRTLAVPAGFAFKCDVPDLSQPAGLDPDDLDVEACVTVVDRICYDLVGKVGTQKQIDNMITESIKKFTEQGSKDRETSGKPNVLLPGSILFELPRPTHRSHVEIRLQKPIADLLEFSTDPREGMKGHREERFAATIDSTHRLLHAYVMQQGYDAMAAGKNLLNVLLEVYQAADALNIGVTKKADVMAFYQSLDASRLSEMLVVCHHCHLPRLLAQLGWADDRLICTPCSKIAGVLFQGYIATSWSNRLREALAAIRKLEAQFYEATWDQETHRQRLFETHKVSNASFMDAYDGIVTASDVMRVDTPTRSLSGRNVSPPFSPSIDQVYSKWQEENSFYLHHPENTVITKACMNFLKYTHCPAALPVYQRSQALFDVISSLPPVVGYHDQIAQEMATVERACDNIYIIDHADAFRKKYRVSESALLSDKQYKDKYIAQQKSGVWDGTPIGAAREKTLWASRADLYGWRGLPDKSSLSQQFVMWTQDEIDTLLQDVVQIEANVKFNPFQLRIPRCADGKTPWFWVVDQMPGDADMEFMFREFQARLRTWDDICDEKNQTVESPATLFIEYVVQWFQTGGKCHIFGFIMSYAAGYMSVYAFARGVTALDEDNNQRDVLPGEIMRSGCMVLLPRDMTKDYDVRRRTVIIESSAANRLRHDYLGGTGLIDQLRQGVRDIATSSQYFGPVLSYEQYREVPKLASWRSKAGLVQKLDPSEIGMADDELLEDPEAEAEGLQLSDFDDISKEDSATKSAKEDEDAVEGEALEDIEQGPLAAGPSGPGGGNFGATPTTDDPTVGEGMEGLEHEVPPTHPSGTGDSLAAGTGLERSTAHQGFFERIREFIPAEHAGEYDARMTELLETFKDSMDFTERMIKRTR